MSLPPTRWELTGEGNRGYGQHFGAQVAQGVDVDGEARFVDALAPRGARILDIGSGMGRVSAALRARGHTVVATEPDPALKLAVFSTGPAIRNPLWNMITEVIGTFVLIFVLLMSGGTATAVGPLFVALLVVGIGASLGGPTGYAINPARDLGPRIAHALLPIKGKGSSDWSYAWVPIVGPIVGAIIAALLFKALGSDAIFDLSA